MNWKVVKTLCRVTLLVLFLALIIVVVLLIFAVLS